MHWEAFEEQATELAELGRDRLERPGLCLVGTLRRDGWPRISPVEPYITVGHLFLGMMPRSRKARDLLRDPRVVVHSVTCGGLRRSGYGVFVLSPPAPGPGERFL